MSKHRFGAEISRVLKLMIHSIYTNKEIFLRELISNASDACDKMKYELLQNGLSNEGELRIDVCLDEENGTITVRDNGIGMSAKDMEDNLGVIASSDTQRFIEQMEKGDKRDISASNQIGQFGVGFYSSFMVADKVEVTSRKFDAAEGEKAKVWISEGEDTFEIADSDRDISRGTEVKLYIKKSESQFLNKHKLKHIITAYSDHIPFNITFIDSASSEVVNKGVAIWIKNKRDITTHDYNEFFRSIAHTPDDPWMTLHNVVEGNISYTSLLFIPKHKPYDLFHPDRKSRVKLYIKRVFITEDNADIIPSYLRFLKGVIDSNDLPLNLSRETLQYNNSVSRIKKSIVKKMLVELKKKANEHYDEFIEFWTNFGEVLKEGLCESALEEKEELLDICRFKTTKSGDKFITFSDYVEGMVDGQEEIFYITGDKMMNLEENPQLEGFKKRDIEVLLLGDSVDDFWVQVVHQYKNKALKSITQTDVDLNKIKEMDEKSDDDADDVIQYFKEVLSGVVADVKISKKLISSPVCLSTSQGAMSSRMEKMLLDQKQLHKRANKILEINPKHHLVQRAVQEKGTQKGEDLVKILFAEACLIENEPIAQPHDIVSRINRLLVAD